MKSIKGELRDIFHPYKRFDTSGYERGLSHTLPIYGVYHVLCDPGWQHLVSAQVWHLRLSGLLGATRKLYVSCVWRDGKDVDELTRLVGSDKLEIVSATDDASVYEYPALRYIHEKSQTEDCLWYYFHTKGVSFNYGKTYDKRYLRFVRNIIAWRGMMEYFIMDKWHVAVNVLSGGYDTYGCYRWPPRQAPHVMYYGNFWWARSSYLRSLTSLNMREILSDRLFAELWIYSGHGKKFSPFDALAQLYYVYLPTSLYTQVRPPLRDRMSFAFHLNLMKFRKKVLRHNYSKVNKRFSGKGYR